MRLAGAHQPGRGHVVADADHQPLARRPGTGDGVGAHEIDHLRVHPLGGLAQRHLAQRGQVAGVKKLPMARAACSPI